MAWDPARYTSEERDQTYPTGRECTCEREGHKHWHRVPCFAAYCNDGHAERFRLFHIRKTCETCNGIGFLYACCCGADLWRSKSHDSCAIATAALDTPSHPDLDILRSFRDTKLKKNPVSLVLVGYYALIKRPIAEFVRGKPRLKRFLLETFIVPAVHIQRSRRRYVLGTLDDVRTFAIFIAALAFVTLLYPIAIAETKFLHKEPIRNVRKVGI